MYLGFRLGHGSAEESFIVLLVHCGEAKEYKPSSSVFSVSYRKT